MKYYLTVFTNRTIPLLMSGYLREGLERLSRIKRKPQALISPNTTSSMETRRGKESIVDRITAYLPSSEVLSIKPSSLDLKRRDEYRKTRPGDDFALVLHEGKLAMVPSWHPLNQTPKSANSAVYGTGSMETLSFEPVLDANSGAKERDIIGANIVFLEPRMDRLYDRALPSREVKFPVDRKTYAQGISDLMAVLGKKVLVGQDNEIGIGSIRVQVGPGMGKFGKSAVGQQVDASVESYYGKKSFPERAYQGEGLVLSAGPDQRFQEFRGKHSSHYGEGGRIGEVAKRLGANDAILFAPYDAQDPSRVDLLSQYKGNPKGLEQAMLHLALSDGLGAELLAVRKDGTVLLPPMDVNRLGGVTADYIMKYLAPALGIPTEEAAFNLQQVIDGEIVGLFFAGNAARVAAIGEIKLHDASEQVLRQIHLDIPDTTKRLIDRFEREVHGMEAPAHPSIVTPINLQEGERARKILEQAFSDWM